MSRFALVSILAAGLLAGGEARAQLTCTPNRLLAGAELRIGSPGAFGASPSGEVRLTYRNTAGGSATLFSGPRSWSAREVAFLLPAGLADGVYEVALSSPAGALRNPACFTIGPPLVAAPLAPRTVVAGIALATLDAVVDGDWPCDGETKITLWGKHFAPGTEVSGFAPSAWRSGKTAVEVGSEGRPSAGFPPSATTIARLVVRDPGTIEFTVSRCLLMLPGLKVRVWLPDGGKTAWQQVRTAWDHPGSGDGVLTIP